MESSEYLYVNEDNSRLPLVFADFYTNLSLKNRKSVFKLKKVRTFPLAPGWITMYILFWRGYAQYPPQTPAQHRPQSHAHSMHGTSTVLAHSLVHPDDDIHNTHQNVNEYRRQHNAVKD